MRNYQYRSQVDERPAPPREQGALYHAIVAVSVVAALAPVFVALWVGCRSDCADERPHVVMPCRAASSASAQPVVLVR